ncbi:glycosyltransferase [Peribacillus faecalis]|nr:glycosyltransferase [Peribacillus faecalis]
MIFVTVGTHEQPFDRLLGAINHYAAEKQLAKEQIVVQKGFSKLDLENVTSEAMYSASQMNSFYNEAEVIISHGGPGSMFPAWLLGKQVIAVPRQNRYKEHVDDHQVEFCKFVEKSGKVICVDDISDLPLAIETVMANSTKIDHQSKTSAFVQRFEKELLLISHQ